MSDAGLEVLKAGLALCVATASLLIASSLGQRLNRRWDEDRRQRELDLAALASFYKLYGDFFAIWKEWSTARPRSNEHYIDTESDVAWSLLQRACAVEGGFEALLVKLSLERTLEESQLVMLARFRQAYQSLREAIRADSRLEWRAARDLGDASAKYLYFKHLAADFAQLLADEGSRRVVAVGAAGDTLVAATQVESRDNWWAAT